MCCDLTVTRIRLTFLTAPLFVCQLLASGTEHFNVKPAKGIQFLQDNGLLSSPLDPKEVVNFIKVSRRGQDSPPDVMVSHRSQASLSQRPRSLGMPKMIGEYAPVSARFQVNM